MTVVATSSNRFSQVVKHEYDPATGYCRDVVTVNDSAQTLKVGTLLGKVTATGKYVVCKQAAADGSQNVAAVFVGDALGFSGDLAIAATTDTSVLTLTRGPLILSAGQIIWDASFTTQSQKDTAFANMKAAGVMLATTV